MRKYLLHGTELPLTEKISPAYCLGYRVLRPLCGCCGGSIGVRRAWRKLDKHSKDYHNWQEGKSFFITSRGKKPKYKDHRNNLLEKGDI